MRGALRLTGNLLILTSVLGLIALAVLLIAPEQAPTSVVGQPARSGVGAPGLTAQSVRPGASGITSAQTGTRDGQASVGALAPTAFGLPGITHVTIPSIELSADVVPAALLERDGGSTWEVPAFKVGHAEATAGAGQRGNAVLLGHVTSLRSGNVFQDLDRVEVGDSVEIFADAAQFDYTVVAKDRVQRTDSTVLEQGETQAVSLITCTGVWLPTIWDYTQRLVVRAELSQHQSQNPSDRR